MTNQDRKTAEVKKYFQDRVYQTIIPRNVRLSEAPSHGEPIILYDARSRGAAVYTELAKEVIYNGERIRKGINALFSGLDAQADDSIQKLLFTNSDPTLSTT